MYVAYGHSVYSGVHGLEFGHVSVVAVLGGMRLHVGRPRKQFPHHNHRENHAYHAQGIGHGAAQCGSACRYSKLLERLLCGTQSGSVGGGSAKHTHHVGHAYSACLCYRHGRQGAQGHQREAVQVELQAPRTEGTEEARPHFQAEFVDKQHKAEILRVFKHLRVNGETEMSSEDTHEKHERDAERHAPHTDFTEAETYGYDYRQHAYRLHRTMAAK